MKTLIWMAIGAVIVQQVAKRMNISSLADLKDMMKSSYKGLKKFAVNPN